MSSVTRTSTCLLPLWTPKVKPTNSGAMAVQVTLAVPEMVPEPVEALADDVLRRRARHVVTENARTLAARDALADGDLTGWQAEGRSLKILI